MIIQCPPRSAFCELLFLSVCLFVFVWTTVGSENHWFPYMEVANFTIPLIIHLFALAPKKPRSIQATRKNGLSYLIVEFTNSRLFSPHTVSISTVRTAERNTLTWSYVFFTHTHISPSYVWYQTINCSCKSSDLLSSDTTWWMLILLTETCSCFSRLRVGLCLEGTWLHCYCDINTTGMNHFKR
jgi:hypothetical protein